MVVATGLYIFKYLQEHPYVGVGEEAAVLNTTAADLVAAAAAAVAGA
uniref:Uncharacterized protein n=1 Tax=Carcinus maenas virus 1 TaxID=2704945 RepID=A0A6G9HDM1_9VIRU|nr:hypothetical protein [Carcinus maenas virus 1]